MREPLMSPTRRRHSLQVPKRLLGPPVGRKVPAAAEQIGKPGSVGGDKGYPRGGPRDQREPDPFMASEKWAFSPSI